MVNLKCISPSISSKHTVFLLPSKSFSLPEKEAPTIKTVKFDLPDGTFIELGDEIVKANEALFQPSLCGSQEAGVQDIITECLYKVDSDVRRELLANVVLAGGNTLHKNYAAR